MLRASTPAAVVSLLLLAAGTAVAQQSQPSPPATEKAMPPAPDASAEVKAAKGVENKQPVGEATSFASGDKVWIWSRIKGASGRTVKHVWKKDGTAVWTATLKVNSNLWTTSSRRTVKPGQYTVVVETTDGATLGEVSFSVQ